MCGIESNIFWELFAIAEQTASSSLRLQALRRTFWRTRIA